MSSAAAIAAALGFTPIPASGAPVQSVAGLTGAPTVGQVAGALVGTAAGTLAAGNDSRITGALQTSSAGPLAMQAGASPAAAIAAALGFTPIAASGAPVQSVAGLTGSPNAVAVATAIGAVTVTPGDTANLILSNGSRVGLGNLSVSGGAIVAPSGSGGGNVSTDTAGTISAQTTRATNGVTARTLAARAHDVFNVMDLGASGTGAATTIGSVYPGVTLTTLAATTINGATPYAGLANPLMGLTFSMTTSAAQTAPGSALQFLSNSPPGVLNWVAKFAQWEDPLTRNFVLLPGMTVSSTNPCLGSGLSVGATTTGFPDQWSIPAVPYRAFDLLPAPPTGDTWITGQAYPVGTVRTHGGYVYYVSTAITTSANPPTITAAGTQPLDGGVWTFIAPIPTVAEADWAPNTAYAAGAIVDGNGGQWIALNSGTSGSGRTVSTAQGPTLYNPFTYGGPTYGGSYGQPWQASYVGTKPALDGTIQWLLLNRKEYRNLPLGTVTLSGSTATACPQGTVVTFTIPAATLQSYTTDWLAGQTAIAQATAAGGGEVYFPAGQYVKTAPWINPAQTQDTSQDRPTLAFRGAGVGSTKITDLVDTGTDTCSIAEAQAAGTVFGWYSNTVYSGFLLKGPNVTQTIGTSPVQMDGLCVGQTAIGNTLVVNGYHSGLAITGDHQSFRDSTFTNNTYNLLFAPYGDSQGNQAFDHVKLAGSEIASVGISSTNQIDSADFYDVHTGFGPLGFYAIPASVNVQASNSGVISNTNLNDPWNESPGNGFMWLRANAGSFTNNHVTGGGSQGSVGNPFYSLQSGLGYVGNYTSSLSPATLGVNGVVRPNSVYRVKKLQYNTFYSTKTDGFVYQDQAHYPNSGITDAIYATDEDCTDNLWVGDTGVLVGNASGSDYPTAAIPTLRCNEDGNGASTNNRFVTSDSSGEFHMAGYFPQVAGDVLTFAGNGDNSLIYTPAVFPSDGVPFLGVAANACTNDSKSVCPVITSGAATVFSTLGVAGPGAVYPTMLTSSAAGARPGVAQGIDQTGAIGFSLGTCSAWTSGGPNCAILVTSNAGGGAHGAATGLTATGTTQATAYQITSVTSQFTAVPSGTGAILGNVPIGASETTYNDGANALLVYPPVGSSINSLPVNTPVSVPATGGLSIKRLSGTLWHY